MQVCSWIISLYTQTNGGSLHGSRPDGILGAELAKPIDWTTEKLSAEAKSDFNLDGVFISSRSLQ